VAPPKFEIELGDRGETHSFRVFNYDDDPITAEVSVHNWELDENNKTRILPPTEQSLDSWIAINPVRFTIPPRGSQVVRFAIRPKVELVDGEHRAILYVTSKPTEEKALSVRFNLRIGMAVYGYVGAVERVGELVAVAVDPAALRFEIESRGNAHVRLAGRFAVWRADAYPEEGPPPPVPELPEAGEEAVLPPGVVTVGELPAKPVLAGTRRTVPQPLAEPLPPGDYVLRLVGTLGASSVERTLPFSIPSDTGEAAAPSGPSPPPGG
jgi:hypothetical protein